MIDTLWHRSDCWGLAFSNKTGALSSDSLPLGLLTCQHICREGRNGKKVKIAIQLEKNPDAPCPPLESLPETLKSTQHNLLQLTQRCYFILLFLTSFLFTGLLLRIFPSYQVHYREGQARNPLLFHIMKKTGHF